MRDFGKQLRLSLFASAAMAAFASWSSASADGYNFTPGNLVISIYGNGTVTDNQATPITLKELTTSGSVVGQIALPQTTTSVNGVTNYAISGEYGSSSEGTLELSGNGQYLTIAGYGVNASSFNANQASFGGTTKSCITAGASAVSCYPLAQTPSSTVQRVVALVGANGSVDTTTSLGTSAFSGNNPRSVATVDGSSLYISGQGTSSNMNDPGQGVFTATRGAHTSTSIDNSYDTRTVEIYGGKLYVSSDSTEGSGVHENISTYSALPTSPSSATVLSNIASKFAVSDLTKLNTIDGSLATNTAYTTTSKTKGIIYLSPENFFFANDTTLYIADSGLPKGDNNGSGKSAQGLSDGGLQKWSLVNGTWVLDYTLSNGLGIVPDTTACGSNQIGCGTTGLIGLTGQVIGNQVELFATNATLGDLDQTYLYGVTDSLFDLTNPGNEAFTTLATAAPGTNIRGVAFAPSAIAAVPEPLTLSIFGAGLAGAVALRRRKKKA
jgi:hypothetical protein